MVHPLIKNKNKFIISNLSNVLHFCENFACLLEICANFMNIFQNLLKNNINMSWKSIKSKNQAYLI